MLSNREKQIAAFAWTSGHQNMSLKETIVGIEEADLKDLFSDEPLHVTMHVKGSKITTVLISTGEPLPSGDYKIVIDSVVVEKEESNI